MLINSDTSVIHGYLNISQLNDSHVRIHGVVGYLPEGIHGFHVHENGATGDNCRDAGGHFNPTNVRTGVMIDDIPVTSTNSHINQIFL